MIKSELVLKIAAQNPHLYQRDVENVVNAILDTIAARTISLEPRLVAHLTSRTPCKIDILTAGERDKLALLSTGMSSAAIADALRISIGAVDDALTKVYTKLGISNTKAVNPRIAAVLMFQDHLKHSAALDA